MKNLENNSLVSVIVPCYNHEKYVTQTIESIINQTYKNIQLIVIDDGSKDNSPKIIEELQKKYGFIYEVQENIGLPATLNKAIQKYVKGKYVCIVASDDYWELNKIEKQVNYMEKNPQYGMCYCNAYSVDENLNIKNIFNSKKYSGWIFDKLILDNFIPALTYMIKKEVYNTVGLYDKNLFIEDWYMGLKIAEKYQVGYIDEFLAYYRLHSYNVSKNLFKLINGQKEVLKNWETLSDYKKIISHWNLIWLNNIIDRGYKLDALKYFKICAKDFYKWNFIKSLIKFFIKWN